ncbi:OmpA family protein [Erythrobacter aquimaris]|uniref:OmpA family protein n=1 Tax=Qipengyuania aquimaris TaxID=255984 RepID=A0A6I4TNT8_9SPHN|nr:OmpA family protein [Qipengyuania aquimaris]MXO96208.1 OmpA family protein [Qipengyuania aquimaris]
MKSRPAIAIALGAVLVTALGYVGSQSGAEALAQRLDERARLAIAEAGYEPVTARFQTRRGAPIRHPMLSGGEGLDEGSRDRVAKLVAGLPGVGGISWEDGWANASSGDVDFEPVRCQDDVETLLRTRSIRFEEGSAALLDTSNILIDEVADALRPCLGSIIAIIGHTDRSGTEPGNLALSQDRARAVREALVRRGIPRDGLRARGVGSSEPVQGLEADDPANRRIEFSVIRIEPVTPTPVDTPGPR